MRWVDRALGILWGPLLLSTVIAGSPAAQAADQCVACHTDAAKLKALIQAPAEVAEEEGEG